MILKSSSNCLKPFTTSKLTMPKDPQKMRVALVKSLSSAPRPRAAPKTAQTLDLLTIVGSVPNSSGERGMGNGERESWQKNFRPPPISHPARPPAPSRAARQDLPALLKPVYHTLAFRRGISAESSFVNAKHFQPRSFSDAPTRYRVLSSITRNLS